MLFGDSHKLSALAHVNGFWELSPSTYFELGLSGLTGSRVDPETLPASAPHSTGNRTLGFDFTLDWRPPERSTRQQFTLSGAGIMNRRVYPGAPDLTAHGAFAIAEYKFDIRWTAGGHYEYTQNPENPDQHAWLAGPTLTWWQSEFVRLRAEYEVFRGPLDRFGQFVFQATFAMGPHKHETY